MPADLVRSSPEYGKLPPQNLDAEEAVLGALLIDKEAPGEVMDLLTVESFYKDAHGIIYKAISSLVSTSNQVDIVSVVDALRTAGSLEDAGGPLAIAELSNKVMNAAAVRHHAEIVKDKAARREIIRVSTAAAQEAYSNTIPTVEVASTAMQAMSRALGQVTTGSAKSLREIGMAEVKRQLNRKDGDFTGIPSGMAKVDMVTGGWQPTDLIILAARPGMGKTAQGPQLTQLIYLHSGLKTKINQHHGIYIRTTLKHKMGIWILKK